MIRVTRYIGRVYHTSTGSVHEQEYPFTQAQASEVGGVLEPDGLDYVLACKLCAMWTRRGQHTSIRYSYTTRTEDDLRYWERKPS